MQVNKIYCGDALDVLKTFPDNCVDLVITDPPYEQSVDHGSGAFGVEKKISFKQIVGISNGFDPVILDELCRVMKKINLYIFCSQKQIIPLLDYFATKRGCNYNILSWHKTNPVPTCNNKFLPDTEFCLFFREKGVKLGGDIEIKNTYFLTPSNQADKKIWGHPTIKPLPIIEALVKNSSVKGDLILDPFIGSGTTAVAARKHGRNYIGIEINPEYIAIAEKRIKEAAKQLNLFERSFA